MTIQAGNNVFGGNVFVVTIDESNLVTQIIVPPLGDGAGPATINFAPGMAIPLAEGVILGLLHAAGIPGY